MTETTHNRPAGDMRKTTCATCRHIGGHYWGDFDRQEHYCGKSSERRRDAMRPTGDFAQDFIDNFRAFFDASARQAACRYYEEAPPLSGTVAALLELFDAEGVARFSFFSKENEAAARHRGILFEQDCSLDERGGAVRGYRLTNVGKMRRADLLRAIPPDGYSATAQQEAPHVSP